MKYLNITDIIAFIKRYMYVFSLYARKIAGTVSIFFIARYLSVYDYGLYASYTEIISYLLLFANLGYNDYILVSSNNETKKVKLKQTFFISFAIMLCFVISLAAFAIPLENKIIFILIVFRYFFDTTFFGLALSYFQSSKKFFEIGVINTIYSIFIILAALSAFIFKLSLYKYLIICIILGLINFVQCSIFIKISYIRIFDKFIHFFKMLDKSIFTYMLSALLFTTNSSLPALFVAIFVDKETAALFFAANTIATVLSLYISAKSQQIMPELINTSKQHIIKVIKSATLEIFYVNIVVIIFLAITGKYILRLLYGQEYYTNAYIFLMIILFIKLIGSLATGIGTYITASGNQKFKTRCQAEFIIVSLIAAGILYQHGIYAVLLMLIVSYMYALPRFGIFVYNNLKNKT